MTVSVSETDLAPGDRLTNLRELLEAAGRFAPETLGTTLPDDAHALFAGEAFRVRLAGRFLRRVGAFADPAQLGRTPILPFLEQGPDSVSRLVARSGLICHEESVRRLVYAQDRRRLATALGLEIPAQSGGGVGPSHSRWMERLRLVETDGGIDTLIEAILDDGSLSCACWIEELPEIPRRAMTLIFPRDLRLRAARQMDARTLSHPERRGRALLVGAEVARSDLITQRAA